MKFICTAEIEIDAESTEDARIELCSRMDAHDIWWNIENEELEQ